MVSAWSDDDIATLKVSVQRGDKDKVIAHRLGRSIGAVRTKMTKLGVYRTKVWTGQSKMPAVIAGKLFDL